MIKFLKFLRLPIRSNIYSISTTRHTQINQEYQEYKQNKWNKTTKSQSKHFIPQSAIDKETKELLESIKQYEAQLKYETIIDTTKLVKMLSRISYSHSSQTVVQEQIFKDVLKNVADVELFNQIQNRDVMNLRICIIYNVRIPEIWENLWGFVKNYSHQLNNEQKLLLLETFNTDNQEYLNEFFTQFEDDFLKEIKNEKVDLNSLGNVLQVYKKFSKGSESFHLTIKQYLLQNIPEMKIPYIIKFLQHYALNPMEALSERKELLQAIQLHLFKIVCFLNIRELIIVLFCYVRTSLGTDVLYRLLDERIFLLSLDMNLSDLQQLMVIGSNESRVKKTVFSAVEQALSQKIKGTRPTDMIEAMYLFSDSQMASEDFMNKLADHVYPCLFTASVDQMVDLVWAMHVNANSQEKWFEKAGEAIAQRIDEMNVSHMAQFVWLMSDYFKRLQFPQDSKIDKAFKIISVKLMNKFEKFEEIGIKDCAKVLNAYVQNLPISAYLVDLIFAYVINLKDSQLDEQMDTWDLSTILWGFSYIDNYPEENKKMLYEFLAPSFMDKIDEMSVYELLVSLKSFILTKTEERQMIQVGISKCLQNVDNMESLEQVYLSLFVFTNTKFKNEQDQDLLIKQLQSQAQKLKQISSKTEQDIDNQTKEFLLNQEILKYKD